VKRSTVYGRPAVTA